MLSSTTEEWWSIATRSRPGVCDVGDYVRKRYFMRHEVPASTDDVFVSVNPASYPRCFCAGFLVAGLFVSTCVKAARAEVRRGQPRRSALCKFVSSRQQHFRLPSASDKLPASRIRKCALQPSAKPRDFTIHPAKETCRPPCRLLRSLSPLICTGRCYPPSQSPPRSPSTSVMTQRQVSPRYGGATSSSTRGGCSVCVCFVF